VSPFYDGSQRAAPERRRSQHQIQSISGIEATCPRATEPANTVTPIGWDCRRIAAR